MTYPMKLLAFPKLWEVSAAPQLFRSMFEDKPALYFPLEVAHLAPI